MVWADYELYVDCVGSPRLTCDSDAVSW